MVNYVGPWLTEPIHPATPPAVDDKLATSLTMAFLLHLAGIHGAFSSFSVSSVAPF